MEIEESKRKPANLVCIVCRAEASDHFHYGAICCFSCRAFFRRYSCRWGKLKCVRDNIRNADPRNFVDCPVNEQTRNDCMRCRLKKCFDGGMKKDFVRGPNRNLRRKREEQGFKGRKRRYSDGGGKTSEEATVAVETPKIEPILQLYNDVAVRDEALDYANTTQSDIPGKYFENTRIERQRFITAESASEYEDEIFAHHAQYPRFELINHYEDDYDYFGYNKHPTADYYPMPSPLSPSLSRSSTPSIADSFPRAFLNLLPRKSLKYQSAKPRFGFFPSDRIRELKSSEEEENGEGEEGIEEDLDSNPSGCQLNLFRGAKGDPQSAAPVIKFTMEELKFVDFIRRNRINIVSKISNAYYDEQYRDELLSVLMSRGRVKPSFQFMEKLNKSVMEASLKVLKEVLDLFELSPSAKQVLVDENGPFGCLVGSAVYMHGNNATTFVEQAKEAGMTTMFIQYLEDNNLAAVVPRLESHYLNPSPWAAREEYETEFDNIMREIGSNVGKDQFLTCLLTMTHLFTVSRSKVATLSTEDLSSINNARRAITVLLNRYLREKHGYKKASSKTHHHFYLMSMLKRISKIYMEKKLLLMQADQISDITLCRD